MDDWLNEYQKFSATPWSPTTLKPAEEQQFVVGCRELNCLTLLSQT